MKNLSKEQPIIVSHKIVLLDALAPINKILFLHN